MSHSIVPDCKREPNLLQRTESEPVTKQNNVLPEAHSPDDRKKKLREKHRERLRVRHEQERGGNKRIKTNASTRRVSMEGLEDEQIQLDDDLSDDGACATFSRSVSLPVNLQMSAPKNIQLGVADFFTNRAKMDELQYLLGGLEVSQLPRVHLSSAQNLATFLKSKSNCFAIRSHGGFRVLLRTLNTLRKKSDDVAVRFVLTTIYYILSKDTNNVQCFSQDCVEGLVTHLNNFSNIQKPTTPPPSSSRQRRQRRKPKKSPLDMEKLFSGEATVITRDYNDITIAYLATLSLKNASSSTHFKEILFRSGYISEISKCLRADFSIVAEAKTERTCLRWRDQCHRLRGLLTVLENATHNRKCTSPICHEIVLNCLNVVGWHSENLSNSPNQKDLTTETSFVGLQFSRHTISGALKVLINLTNNPNAIIESKNLKTILDLALKCHEKKASESFSHFILCLGLLINSLEHSAQNRNIFRLISAKGNKSEQNALKWLASLFLKCRKAGSSSSDENEIMDNNITASYLALLLGLLVKDCSENSTFLVELFPDKSLSPLVDMLKHFIEFQSRANTLTRESLRSILSVIKILKSEIAKENQQESS